MRLADFINEDSASILEEWDVFAASLMPAAAAMDRAALRDHAEQILRAIAKDLRASQTRAQQTAKARGEAPASVSETAAQTHALLRAKAGFTIRQLVAEYRALRASVLRLWSDAHAYGPEAMHDVTRFNEAIDQAIAESVDHFSSEVDRVRSVFLGVLAHDLRDPLNAVLMTSQMMSRLVAGTAAAQHAARLVSSGTHMKELIDDLLDYSRAALDVGIPVSRVPGDLESVCREVVELLRAALPAASIEFESDGPALGMWDATRMKQVVGNLVANATRYGDSGGTIHVRLRGGGDDDVRLSVENPGPAIPEDQIGSLFEPLRRGTEPGAGEPRDSLGLGLFIVRQIALAHGGDVGAQCAGGRTTFTVTLPKE